MEKVGATNIFERSVQKHGLYYTSFYGDGENVYGPVKPVTKYECIGHYQKRVGNGSETGRANYGKKRNLVEQNDRLLQKMDILQNYFGIALRQCRQLRKYDKCHPCIIISCVGFSR